MFFVKTGLVVFSIILIRRIAWGHIARRMQYLLWIVAMIMMLCSPLFHVPSRISIENVVGDVIDSKNSVVSVQVSQDNSPRFTEDNTIINRFVDNTLGQVVYNPVKTEGESTQKRRVSILDALNVVNVVVSVILMVGVIAKNIMFYWHCRRNRCLYKNDLEIGLSIYSMKNINSPYLFGKGIYVDESVIADENMMKYIVSHEYHHYKHLDFLWSALRTVTIVMNWYNPFVWVASAYMKRDCELACDEAVVHALNESERKEYGYVLVSLANSTRKSMIAPMTSMVGNKDKLKERILVITGKPSASVLVSVIVVICMVVLCGCTFTEKKKEQIIDEIIQNEGSNIESDTIGEASNNLYDDDTREINEAGTIKSMNEEVQQADFNIYNSVQFYDGYFYYSDDSDMKRIDKGLQSSEVIAEGNNKLYNIDNGYLYYLRCPSENIQNPGIVRMNLDTMLEEVLIGWDDEMWLCSAIYVDNATMYIEGNGVCECYNLESGSIQTVSDEENIIYKYMDNCKIGRDAINNLAYGYVSTCINYGKLVLINPTGNNTYEISVYDVTTGKELHRIENCEISLLTVDRGVVYTTGQGDVYLEEWSGENCLLYSSKENSEKRFNYGNYDKDYLYGFVEKTDGFELKRISWTGESETIKEFSGSMKNLPYVNYSISNGIQSYWVDGNVVFENVN